MQWKIQTIYKTNNPNNQKDLGSKYQDVEEIKPEFLETEANIFQRSMQNVL